MPSYSRTFRVFVSSTFSDFQAERNALQATVWPELKRITAERGCRFQAIDLRWGISREASHAAQTMTICLREISRCQKLSPRPNFILLLGQRYGYQPLPEQIPADEVARIREQLTPRIGRNCSVPRAMVACTARTTITSIRQSVGCNRGLVGIWIMPPV
jgi:hypothetical protein